MAGLTETEAHLVLWVWVVYAWAGWRLWKRVCSGPSDYWTKLGEAIDREERWHRCKATRECEWPDYCRPGDCRRPGEGR